MWVMYRTNKSYDVEDAVYLLKDLGEAQKLFEDFPAVKVVLRKIAYQIVKDVEKLLDQIEN